MIKLYLKIPSNLKVLQENGHQGSNHPKKNRVLNKSSYLSVSHYNNELKSTDYAIAFSFCKPFSEFISAALLSLKICEKKFKQLVSGWKGRRELWTNLCCEHNSFPLNPLVVPVRAGYWSLYIFPFVESRLNFVVLLSPSLNLDYIDIVRNTLNTSDIHLLLADFSSIVQ